MNDKIELFVPSDDGPVLIGCVEVPDLTTYEEAAAKLLLCWADWREEHSDADDFVQWLVRTHGWADGRIKGYHHLELPMLTPEQVKQQVNLTGNVTHIVEFEFSDLFEYDEYVCLGDFLQVLNEKVTGCGGASLTNISYQIVGHGDGKVLIKVFGEVDPT